MKETENSPRGNQDEKEKARKLTPAEERRLRAFEARAESLKSRGYRRVELTVGIVRANVFAVVLLIPLLAAGIGAFLALRRSFTGLSGPVQMGLFVVTLAVLIVVHELIHGLSWAIFARHHWKDIEFGFMKEYLTPYCTCLEPLTRGQYAFGAVMPLVLLGILPMIIGVAIGSFPMLLMGIIMADSAAGDILIVWKILRYRSDAGELVYMDHPTQAGGVIFER